MIAEVLFLAIFAIGVSASIILPLFVLSLINLFLLSYFSVNTVIILLPGILFLDFFAFAFMHAIISAIVYRLFLPIEEGEFEWNSQSFTNLLASSKILPAFKYYVSSMLYRNAAHILSLIFSLYWTPGIILSLFGTKMGKNVLVLGRIVDPSLLEIGNNSFIGLDSGIVCHIMKGKKLVLKKVKIGNNCVIGGRSILFPGVEVGDDAVVAAGAVVLRDTKIPAGTMWGGVPAKQLKGKRSR